MITMVSGAFLTLHEDSKGVDGMKQNICDGVGNLGVVSALLLTLVVPMFYGSIDDFLVKRDEDYQSSGAAILDSWLCRQFDHDRIDDISRGLANLMHASYVISLVAFLFSTLSSVYILLCVNGLGDDNGAALFVQHMGKAIRLPYIFFTGGMAMFGGVLARLIFTVRSLEAMIIELVVAGVMVTSCCGLSQFYCVHCTCITLYNTSTHEPLVLTPTEVEEDVLAYFENAGPCAALEECLWSLQARTKAGACVPLSSVTRVLAKAAYHRKMVQILGLIVPDEAIYQVSSAARFVAISIGMEKQSRESQRELELQFEAEEVARLGGKISGTDPRPWSLIDEDRSTRPKMLELQRWAAADRARLSRKAASCGEELRFEAGEMASKGEAEGAQNAAGEENFEDVKHISDDISVTSVDIPGAPKHDSY